MSSISDTFERLAAADRAAFIPFLAAGDPDLETSLAVLTRAAAEGADLIEVGIPFSDPIADGPVIQAAFTRALAGGLTVDLLFRALARVRPEIDVPLLGMVSYSIVHRVGSGRFCEHAAEAGLAGLVVPDLPPDDGAEFYAAAEGAGLDSVLLVAPTTPPTRRDLILARTRGFLYYVSLTGITGERERLSEDVQAQVADLKARGSVPVCVGFGVGTPEQAAAMARAADGVIVGSALVRRVHEAAAGGGDAASAAGTFIREMAQAVHTARTRGG